MKQNGKKRGLLLLLFAMLWCVLPSARCLVPGRSMSRACCTGMTPGCPMQGPEVSGSCCQIQPDQAVAVPDIPMVPKQDPAAAMLPHGADIVTPVLIAANGWYHPESSPPEISPGARTILRI